MISFTDKNGNTTTYYYNCCRLISNTDPLGYTENYSYDPVGNRTSVIDANGNTTAYEYDELNRLTRITSPMGNETQFNYDGLGNITERTDPNGNTTSYGYDVLNQLITTSYPDGSNAVNQYDAAGNIVQISNTGGIGDITTYQYDALNRVISTETNYGIFSKVVNYTYDNVGNRISLAAPGGTITWNYDALNRIVNVTDQNGGQTEYEYDGVGNRISMGYPNNIITPYEYDDANRLIDLITTSSTGDTIQRFAYEYDPVGNKTMEIHEDGSYITYEYDDVRRLINVTRIIPTYYCIPTADCSYGDGFTDFTMADISNLDSGCSPDGYGDFTYMSTDLTAGNTYDVTMASGWADQQVCLWIDFNDNKELEEDERLLTDVALAIAGQTYTFEVFIPLDVSDVTTRMRIRANWENSAADPCANFSYGETEDYTVVIGGGGPTRDITLYTLYTYDVVGNRLTKNENGNITYYEYNEDDRVLSAGDVSFSYDNNGNRITKIDTDGTTYYEFDYENRLINVTLPDDSYISYYYSPEGKRLSKDENGWLKYYLFGSPFVIEEMDEEGYSWITYNPGISIVLEMIPGYYHGEGFGSTTLLTNPEEEIVATAEFDEFGIILNSSGWWMNDRILFRVMEYEQNTELYRYNDGYYYDPDVDCFLEEHEPDIQLAPFAFFQRNWLYKEPKPKPPKPQENWDDPDPQFPSGFFQESTSEPYEGKIFLGAMPYSLAKSLQAAPPKTAPSHLIRRCGRGKCKGGCWGSLKKGLSRTSGNCRGKEKKLKLLCEIVGSNSHWEADLFCLSLGGPDCFCEGGTLNVFGTKGTIKKNGREFCEMKCQAQYIAGRCKQIR